MDVYGIFGMFCHRQIQRHACKCESAIESWFAAADYGNRLYERAFRRR